MWLKLVVGIVALGGIVFCIYTRLVRGTNHHCALILLRHGVPTAVLRPGQRRILRPGEKVVPISLSWHDLSFGPLLCVLRGGCKIALSGMFSFRVRPNRVADFYSLIPTNGMPEYPNELLRDFLHNRFEGTLHKWSPRYSKISDAFCERIRQEFEHALDDTVETRIVFRPPIEISKEEDLEKVAEILREARDELKTLVERR